MPWLIQKDGDQWCVYKHDADGNPIGESLGCHDTEAEAKAQLAALYASEPEAGGKRMDIIQRIMDFLTGLREEVQRRIKDVESWDGSAANYADTDAYCAACLIDVNSVAGRDTKAQDHCMLPVREAGDSADTYVRQAVHSAAGGYGLTRVKRPDDVPEADWTAAVKAAANKIISAYNQMDEQAPDAIYGLAGKTPPTRERDIGMHQIAEQIMMQVDALGQQTGTWPMINDFYTRPDGSLSIVFTMGGRLYQAPVVMNGTTAVLGNLQEVETQFTPRSIQIVRQANGTARWIAVAAASVLNRVGEIDSRTLFDSFATNVKKNGYPQLRFYHDARLVMGQADWVAREENLYLASGTLNDGPLAQAFIDASEKKRGLWGCSIGFMPTKPAELVEIAHDLSVPVYTEGVNTEISVLPEDMAASWFTTIGLEVTRAMDEAKKKALIALMGDETRANEFIATIEATNRAITEKNLITRETPAGLPAERDTTADDMTALTLRVFEQRMVKHLEERHGKTEKEIDYEALGQQLAKTLGLPDFTALDARIKALEDALAASAGKEQSRAQATTALETRLKALETAEAERERVHNEDMPRGGIGSGVTYRPRAQTSGASIIDSDAAAAPVLEKLHAARKAG